MRIKAALLIAIVTMNENPLSGVEIHRAFLDNGLEVLLVPKKGVPLVTIEVAIRAGSFIEPPELDGLTHLHEHMFFKANRAIPDQETYLKRLDELGMSWNGSTSNEVVRYFFTLPSHLSREGLIFMRDAIQTPLFLEEELEKEREVVIGEYDRWEANPATHLRKAITKGLFGRHYSRKNPIGERGVILSAKREQLQYIQDEFYVPNNAALIVTGQFDPKATFVLVDTIFGGWERKPDPFERNFIPSHPPLFESEYHVVHQPIETSTVLVGWHGPSVTEEPRMAVVADVLYRVLEQTTSEFQKKLVESGLCAAAELSYYTQKYIGPVYLSMETAPEKVLAAVAAAKKEIERLIAGGSIDAAALERARRALVHDEVFEREKPRDFALALAFWWSVGGTEFYTGYLDMVRSVTLEDIDEFCKRYLSGQHVAGVLVSPDAGEEHSITADALRTALGGEPEIVVESRDPEGVDETVLSNGATLLTKTVDSSRTAAFQIHFPGLPARATPEKAGLEQLLLRTLLDVLERKHLAEITELGARFHTSTFPDYSTIGVECLRDSFDRCVQLVAEALTTLEYGEDDVRRLRELMLVEYSKNMSHPQRRVSYVVNTTFYPEGHPYRAYPGGTEESLPELRAEDLVSYRESLVRGANMLIVAVGAITPGAARAAIDASLGELERGETPAVEIADLAGRAESPLTIEKKDIPSNYVLGKFRAPSPGHPDYDALRLALRILDRKLWLEVRSKRALTYAVGSNMIPRLRSMGYVSVSTTKPNEALRVIYDSLDDLIASPPNESTLAASALTFSTTHYIRQESPRGQAEELAWERIATGDHRRASNLAERLQKVTPEDVKRVLSTWVKDIHFGVVGPGEGLDLELFTTR